MTFAARLLIPATFLTAGAVLALARPPAPRLRLTSALVDAIPQIPSHYGVTGPAD